jgi:hypothetical protein
MDGEGIVATLRSVRKNVVGPEKEWFMWWSNQEEVNHFSVEKAFLTPSWFKRESSMICPEKNFLPCESFKAFTAVIFQDEVF